MVDPFDDMVRAAILLIPFKGILLLAVISAFTVWAKDRQREPPWFHISNILCVVMLLSVLEALYTPFAFLDLQNTTAYFAVLAVVSIVLATIVLTRYLLFPLWLSGTVGALFALLSVLWWNYALGLTYVQLRDLVNSMAFYFLGLLFIFVCLLVLETLRHHYKPRREVRTLPTGWDFPTTKERTLRMGEMLLATAVLGIVTMYVWAWA